jgi:hypothetical protein
MARTSSALVQGLLLRDYDTRNNPSLTPFIDTASLVVDAVAACAARKGLTVSDEFLEMLERWLAAHYYTKNNPTYSSKSNDGRSASYIRDPKVPEPYKAGAMELDYTGCLLAVLNSGARVSMTWLGKRPREAVPFVDRM